MANKRVPARTKSTPCRRLGDDVFKPIAASSSEPPFCPVRKLVLDEDYRVLKKGFSVDMRPITLLVGDQGVGKSTVFRAIGENKMRGEGGRAQTVFIDTETVNPRSERSLAYPSMDVGFMVHAKMIASHGETMARILDTMRAHAGKVVMIDEPEAGLSIRSQHRLMKLISSMRSQFIIATHSQVFMTEVGEVFDMETMSWRPAGEFIADQRSAREA
jgi:predicted ATPase